LVSQRPRYRSHGSLGVSENAAQAILATRELIDGPTAETLVVEATLRRDILKSALKSSLYRDGAHKKSFGTISPTPSDSNLGGASQTTPRRAAAICGVGRRCFLNPRRAKHGWIASPPTPAPTRSLAEIATDQYRAASDLLRSPY
jgi:hypothetical protein